MTHDEAEQLLGAYALDATSDEEREQVEAHLAGCPRCQAEVASHREVTAMLAVGLGGEAPAGLWDKVAAATFSARPPAAAPLPPPQLGPLRASAHMKVPRLGVVRAAGRARALAWGGAVAAAAAAVAFASFFGLQAGQLRSQVHQLERRASVPSLAAAAARATAGAHATVTLVAPDGARAATVVVAPHGLAYWLSSSLGELPGTRTYQLWGLVRGKPVSLALLGPDPREVGAFRVEAGTAKLMVTAEPAGGVPLPTTAVLAAGAVPAGIAG